MLCYVLCILVMWTICVSSVMCVICINCDFQMYFIVCDIHVVYELVLNVLLLLLLLLLMYILFIIAYYIMSPLNFECTPTPL